MRIETKTWDFKRSRNWLGISSRFLILLLACAMLTAAPSNQEAAGNGCRKYLDPKSLPPEKKFRHPALDKGCDACHLDCSEAPQAGDGRPTPAYYLKAEEPGLCLECHIASKKDLQPAHDNQPLGKVRCSGCHEPHSSNSPKRIPDVSHGPYDARLCSACHPAPVDGKVQLAAADPDALCYECHTDFQARIEGAKSRHTLFSHSKRSCVECHDPHATNQQHILKRPADEICRSCHLAGAEQTTAAPSLNLLPEQAEKMRSINLSLKHVHEPVGKSCLYCHDAHASDFDAELHAPMPHLCMSCHGANADKIIQSAQPFPLFGGRVSLTPKTFEKLSRLDISLKFVHEPVEVSCTFCHNAHASDYPRELHAPIHTLCIACHGANAEKIIKSGQPFPLFDSIVSVPPGQFKTLKGLALTPDGKRGHPEEGHFVYVPAKDGKPELNCLSCHTPHATDANEKLVVKHKDFQCLDCHK